MSCFKKVPLQMLYTVLLPLELHSNHCEFPFGIHEVEIGSDQESGSLLQLT
jgi:hypothetical protein